VTDDLGAAIADVAARLDAAGIPYMIVGSIAALVHGRARTTVDVDMVIDPDAATLGAFVESLPPADYYVSQDAAIDALRRRTQFNVLDLRTGWKIDLMIKRQRRFSAEELARRSTRAVLGRMLAVASVEDVVIAKLEWAKASESTRQLEDARALVEIAGDQLDRAYIERHVAALDLDELWARVGHGA
jgi:hypothetical protein